MATHAADNLAENIASIATTPSSGGGISAVDTATITASASIALLSLPIVLANPNRKGMIIWNNGSNSAYICYASVASSAACTAIIGSFTSWIMPQPCYRGIISAIRNAGTGTMVVTELL